MSHAKRVSNRRRRRNAVPIFSAAGVSLALAGTASAGTGGSAAEMPSQDTGALHEITLSEEDISDVSLATF